MLPSGDLLCDMTDGQTLYKYREHDNVRDRNLNTYTPLRIIDTPEIEIEFVDSTEAPVGLGEPGTTVVAPAIANAIFNAVGVPAPLADDARYGSAGTASRCVNDDLVFNRPHA